MAHVQIRSPHPTEGTGTIQVLVNGVDLSWDLLAAPLVIESGFPDVPTVLLTVACDALDIDIPESAVKMKRQGRLAQWWSRRGEAA